MSMLASEFRNFGTSELPDPQNMIVIPDPQVTRRDPISDRLSDQISCAKFLIDTCMNDASNDKSTSLRHCIVMGPH